MGLQPPPGQLILQPNPAWIWTPGQAASAKDATVRNGKASKQARVKDFMGLFLKGLINLDVSSRAAAYGAAVYSLDYSSIAHDGLSGQEKSRSGSEREDPVPAFRGSAPTNRPDGVGRIARSQRSEVRNGES
jgi:hypothetical protein